MPSTESSFAAATGPQRAAVGRPFPLLLVILAIVPFALFFFAARANHATETMAADINRSGSLRSLCLAIYGATSQGQSGGGDSVGWKRRWETMKTIRGDLAREYPAEFTSVERAWKPYALALDTHQSVDWPTTDRMWRAADRLTNALDTRVQENQHAALVLLGWGVAALTIALPWGAALTWRLRRSEAQNAVHEAALVRASNRFHELFQAVPAACFTYDRRGHIVEWNRAAEALFDKAASEVIGEPIWEVLSRPERREGTRKSIAEVLAGASFPDLEWNYAAPDATARDIISTVFPLRDDRDAIIGGISVNTDITARRQAEEEMRRLVRGLAFSEARLRSLTARARCLLWAASVEESEVAQGDPPPASPPRLHWDITVLDPEEARRWLPIDWPEKKAFGEAWQDSRPEEDRVRVENDAAAALRSGVSHYTQEYRCVLADGTTRWLLDSVDAEQVSPGHWQVVGVCTDVTLLKDAEALLRAVASDLERSNASLQEFASIASHDLKEPLRKIQTFGDMLRRRARGQLPPDCEGYLDRMIGAAGRMQSLIEGLLDYSRITHKHRSSLPVNLNEIVRAVISDLEARIAETGGRVEVSPLPTIAADPLQMRQLFQNLISNGLKFHKQGIAPVVTVTATVPNEEGIRLVVQDNGIGFDPRYAERVFDMFEKIDGDRRDAGTGVGLAICRKIAERHGGTIRADSQPGAGATFTVTLPASVVG